MRLTTGSIDLVMEGDEETIIITGIIVIIRVEEAEEGAVGILSQDSSLGIMEED